MLRFGEEDGMLPERAGEPRGSGDVCRHDSRPSALGSRLFGTCIPSADQVQFERNNLTDSASLQRTYDALQVRRVGRGKAPVVSAMLASLRHPTTPGCFRPRRAPDDHAELHASVSA